MKWLLLLAFAVSTQATFFRRQLTHSKSHHTKFLGAGKTHSQQQFHAILQLLEGLDASDVVATYYKCSDSSGDDVSGANCVDDGSTLSVNNEGDFTFNCNTANNGVQTCDVTSTLDTNTANHVMSKFVITQPDASTSTVYEEAYLCKPGDVPNARGVAQSCSACEAGKFATLGHGSCTYCAVGKYQNEEGQTECKSCIAGTYLTNTGAAAASDCIDCVAGKFSTATGADAASTCIDCPNGWVTNKITDVVADRTGASECNICAKGKYDHDTSSARAISAHTTCANCDAGKYSDETGNAASTDCINCGAGKYSETEGATAVSTCINCGAGKYLTGTGNDASGDCIPCATGKNSNAGASACVTESIVWGKVYQCKSGEDCTTSTNNCDVVCGDVDGFNAGQANGIDAISGCPTDIDDANVYTSDCQDEWNNL